MLKKLIVYPENTSQFLYVDVDQNVHEEDINIFNFTGSKVENYSIRFEGEKAEINVYDLPKGLYNIIIVDRFAGIIKKAKFTVTRES